MRATRIYLGSLPVSATDDQLFQRFSAYGEVTEAAVAVDRYTSQTKDFGFVQMTNDAAAQQAITGLDGSTPGDRTIRVDVAKPRADRSTGAPRRDVPPSGAGSHRPAAPGEAGGGRHIARGGHPPTRLLAATAEGAGAVPSRAPAATVLRPSRAHHANGMHTAPTISGLPR